jgi:hypothetical protein
VCHNEICITPVADGNKFFFQPGAGGGASRFLAGRRFRG